MVTLQDDPTVAAFDALLGSQRAVVVDFYATWCAPCKTFSPRFAAAAREARRRWSDARVAFVKVDIDRAPELKARYGIQSVPTTVVLERRRGLLGGEKVTVTTRHVGAMKPAELTALIGEVLVRAG